MGMKICGLVLGVCCAVAASPCLAGEQVLSGAYRQASVTVQKAGRKIGSGCRELPEFEPLRIQALRFTKEQAALLYPRIYLCAQPRQPHAFKPNQDGSADSAITLAKRVHPVRVPAVFIQAAILHIERILADTEARFLYPIDFNHGHISVPKEGFQEKYGALWDAGDFTGLMQGVLGDPELKVVYHSQEHVQPKEPPREFIGTFGGKPGIMRTDTMPGGLTEYNASRQSVFDFEFLAHPRGAYSLRDGTRFDISLSGFELATSYLDRIGVVRDYGNADPDEER